MKQSVSTLLFILSLILLFTSCEGFPTAIGTVRDKATNLPLDSVLCNATDGSMMYTDSTGNFEVKGFF